MCRRVVCCLAGITVRPSVRCAIGTRPEKQPIAVALSVSHRTAHSLRRWLANVPKCPLVCRDLTHLSYLNEPGILHVLRQRYSSDAVYTMAGAPMLGTCSPPLIPYPLQHRWPPPRLLLTRPPAPAPCPCRPCAGGSEPLQVAAAVRT